MKKEQAKALVTWLLDSPDLKRTSIWGETVGSPGIPAIRCSHRAWNDVHVYLGTTEHGYIVVAQAYNKDRVYLGGEGELFHRVSLMALNLLYAGRERKRAVIKDKPWLKHIQLVDPGFTWEGAAEALQAESSAVFVSDEEPDTDEE